MSSCIWSNGGAIEAFLYYSRGWKVEFLEQELILREERVKVHVLVVGTEVGVLDKRATIKE